MRGRWNTHRGDDWWYAGGTVVADGVGSPALFEITSIGGSTIAPTALHELLWQTSQQFKGKQLLIVLNRTTSESMATLASCSLVAWKEFRQPYSMWAKVERVSPPADNPSPL